MYELIDDKKKRRRYVWIDLIHGYIEPTITSLVETHEKPPMKERIHHFPFICSQVEIKFDVGGTVESEFG